MIKKMLLFTPITYLYCFLNNTVNVVNTIITVGLVLLYCTNDRNFSSIKYIYTLITINIVYEKNIIYWTFVFCKMYDNFNIILTHYVHLVLNVLVSAL